MRINIVSLGLCLALSGCAFSIFSPTASIVPDEMPTASDAYLYGHFALNTSDHMLEIAFVIRCDDGNEYTIPFYRTTPVQSIKISPSTCSLVEYVYVVGVEEKARRAAPGDLMSNVYFGPGKAYYLGDFVIRATFVSTEMSSNAGWNLVSARDNYDFTTSQMRAIFPNFANFPTEKRLIGSNVTREAAVVNGEPQIMREELRGAKSQECSELFVNCRSACTGAGNDNRCVNDCLSAADDCRRGLSQ